MATSIIKTDELRLLNDQVVMSDGTLTGNVTFPAGHVIQTVQSIKYYADFNSGANPLNATNNDYNSTPSAIINWTQTSILPKSSTSKILVRMGIFLAGERSGPSNAYANIGFTENSSSTPTLTAADYSFNADPLYTHRCNFGVGDISTLDGKYMANSSYMEYLHDHNATPGNYLIYATLTKTSYTNAGFGYAYMPAAFNSVVTLMEIAQ